jgi:alpha-ribazole phosphatase
MKSPTALWLWRHPEPVSSAVGRCYGALDIALSEAGILQAREVAARLRQESFTAIYTSPKVRCQQAAAILAERRECPIETVEGLVEIDFGEFEGRAYDEIAAAYPEVYRQWMERPSEVEFPGGESFLAMWRRVTESAAALRQRHLGESIAIVTHAGVIRILIAHALGLPRENVFRIGQNYGALNLIRYFGGFPVVELVNSDSKSF